MAMHVDIGSSHGALTISFVPFVAVPAAWYGAVIVVELCAAFRLRMTGRQRSRAVALMVVITGWVVTGEGVDGTSLSIMSLEPTPLPFLTP